jgi:hypothetical protein
MEGYVAEDVARTMLQDDATRAAFIEKLQREPAFAADPAARLDFFYRRHPSFDPVVNALPVLRLPSMPMMITSTSPRATATSSASAP